MSLFCSDPRGRNILYRAKQVDMNLWGAGSKGKSKTCTMIRTMEWWAASWGSATQLTQSRLNGPSNHIAIWGVPYLLLSIVKSPVSSAQSANDTEKSDGPQFYTTRMYAQPPLQMTKIKG